MFVVALSCLGRLGPDHPFPKFRCVKQTSIFSIITEAMVSAVLCMSRTTSLQWGSVLRVRRHEETDTTPPP